MTELEPKLFFMCNGCEQDFEFDLTALAGGGWDARGVPAQMASDGWEVDGDRHICPDCAHDRA